MRLKLATKIWALMLSIVLAGTTQGQVENGSLPTQVERLRYDSIGDALPRNAIERFGTLRFQHPSSVIDLALSPDGQCLVSIGSNELVAWDTATGKKLWQKSPRDLGIQLPGAAYGVRSIVFAGESSHFYAVRTGSSVVKCAVLDGSCEVLELASTAVTRFARSLDVTRDGQTFVIGGPDGVRVLGVEDGLLFQVSNAVQGELADPNRDRLTFGGHYSLAQFSPDEERLAVVTSDAPERLRLFDAKTGEERLAMDLEAWLVRMDFSPDGKRLAATERDSSIRVYDLSNGEVLWSHSIEIKNNAESYTSGVRYSHSGELLAMGAPIGSDYWIYLFEASTGKLLHKLKGHAWKPWALAFDSDDQVLYSAGWDGPIRRWDLETGTQLSLPFGMRASPVIAASPADGSVAFADDQGKVHFYGTTSPWEQADKNGEAQAQILSYSPDGRLLAIGGSREDQLRVEIVDVKSGGALQRWEWPKGDDPHSSVESLQFSPDGRYVAAAVFRQNQVLLWDRETEEEALRLPHHLVYGLSFAWHEPRLLTAGWDKSVRQWEISTGKLVSQHDVEALSDGEGDVRMYTVACSPARDLIATAHLDGRVRLWNAQDFTLRNEFQVDGRFIFGSIAFSPDGVWLATGQMNGAVAVYDPYEADRAYAVGQHEHYVYGVSFGEDNRGLVSGGSDEVGYLWDLVPNEVIDEVDMDTLWSDLASPDPARAYRAYWQLIAAGDAVVEALENRLRFIKTLVDLPTQLAELEPEAQQRRRRLSEVLVERDDQVDFVHRAFRGVSILAHIGTERANGALREIARTCPSPKLVEYVQSTLR